MRIYWRSCLREFAANLALGMGLFTLFFFLGQASELLELSLLASGPSLLRFISAFSYLGAHFWVAMLPMIIPMAMLLGAILTMARLHQDRELFALEALGVDVVSYLRGILLALGVIFALIEYPLATDLASRARCALKNFAFYGKSPSDTFRVEPKTWLDLGSAQIFAEEANGLELRGVTLYTDAEKGAEDALPYRATSQTARYSLYNDASTHTPGMSITLGVGKLEFPQPESLGDVSLAYYSSYQTSLALPAVGVFVKRYKDYAFTELRAALRKDAGSELRLEYESRLSLALAPLALAVGGGFAAVALGRRLKGFGFGLALAVIAAYWICNVMFMGLKAPLWTNPAFAVLGAALSCI
ncbi:MAG: LptF/LptG family permease [Elusimicrobiota bacterium]